MTVRSTMSDMISLERKMINDPAGIGQQFSDQDVQDALDRTRDDLRYENLVLAPSIVNTASTANVAQVIYADYFSRFGFWEADIVLQGYLNTAYWKVLTPVSMELLIDEAHFAFELNAFTSGTVPGQIPPIFATGKIYDVYAAAADLLDFWSMVVTPNFDFTSDAQSFRASQQFTMLQKMASYYRRKVKPKIGKAVRSDINIPVAPSRTRLLDTDDILKGA